MDDRWAAAAALVDGSRRALYDYVRRQDHPVTREEAADAEGISRGLAAFHLDKLVEAGLLRADYRPREGEPRGRGRSPKVYQLPDGEAGMDGLDGLIITIPERRYRLMAEILAEAVAERSADAVAAARRLAHQRGRALGAELREQGAPAQLVAVLAGLGFEPAPAEGGRVLLHNCPFHALAARHTGLVCGLNHAFLSGLVEAVAGTELRADLIPRTGACCVTLSRRSAPGPAGNAA